MDKLEALVNRFDADLEIYKDGKKFNEQMTRQQYIDNFLSLLGWDVSNSNGLSYMDREVVVEEFSYTNKKDRPDYTIRLNGISQFHIEAKKVSVNILSDPKSAIQARRYGWNSNHSISVLTNFEYLIIYKTYEMPKQGDNASVSRYKVFHYKEYLERFQEIYDLLSRDSIVNGQFEKWTSKISPEDATKFSLDTVFLDQLNRWRVLIANDLLSSNKIGEDYPYLNEYIQEFLNQIIFLRFAEDNQYESEELLKKEILNHDNYIDYFRKLDKKYNSSLFENSKIISKISMSLLSEIIENLYFPQVSYDFSIIDLSILSKVYENFLQDELILREGEYVLQKTRSASVKAVVSTPYNIVVAMVNRALSEKIQGMTPHEILDLRIADLAVGSGIFLIECYNYIENYLSQWYGEKEQCQPSPLLIPFVIKRQIIENVLIGFDIDRQAVNLTRFSLLLRILSYEGRERIEQISPILPSLENNIICGNSLIPISAIPQTLLMDESFSEINPQNDRFFNEKFDLIIGNPPYLNKEDIKNSTPKIEMDIYSTYYQLIQGQYDKYFLFLERAINAIKENGKVFFLIPNKFITVKAGDKLRNELSKRKLIRKIFDFKYTQIFPNATNYVSVVQIEKSDKLEYREISSYQELYNDESGIEYEFESLGKNHWFLTSDKRLKELYEYAYKNFPSIETEIKPKNGIQTSKNPVYVIPKNATKDYGNKIKYRKNGKTYILEKQILKDFYKPRVKSVGKSYEKLIADNYIVFPYVGGEIIDEQTLKKTFPEAYSYLFDFKHELLPKVYGGKRDVVGSKKDVVWYQYGREQSLKEVTQPKILVGVLSNQPNFNVDKNNFVYASGGTAGYIGLYLRENSPYSLEYIQAWLSHDFTDRIFQTIGSSFENEFYTHGTGLYKDIPLLPIDFNSTIEVEIYSQINQAVKSINELNSQISSEGNKHVKSILMSKKEILINGINERIDQLLEIKMR